MRREDNAILTIYVGLKGPEAFGQVCRKSLNGRTVWKQSFKQPFRGDGESGNSLMKEGGGGVDTNLAGMISEKPLSPWYPQKNGNQIEITAHFGTPCI